jgi:beta-phosphoglucomutase
MERQTPFQAAIFDMDGTLVDNMSFHSRALIEVTRRLLGIELSVERAEREFAGVKNAEILETIVGRPMTAQEALLWSDEKDARYRELYRPHLGLIRGARELLTRLRKAGLGVALASAAPMGNRDFVLDGLDVRNLFDQIVGQEDAARGKPAPDLFLTAASRLGLDPSVCVVFEDAVNGILGARAAGMQAVGLTTVCDEEELRAAGARWTLSDLSELPMDLEQKLFG